MIAMRPSRDTDPAALRRFHTKYLDVGATRNRFHGTYNALASTLAEMLQAAHTTILSSQNLTHRQTIIDLCYLELTNALNEAAERELGSYNANRIRSLPDHSLAWLEARWEPAESGC